MLVASSSPLAVPPFCAADALGAGFWYEESRALSWLAALSPLHLPSRSCCCAWGILQPPYMSCRGALPPINSCSRCTLAPSHISTDAAQILPTQCSSCLSKKVGSQKNSTSMWHTCRDELARCAWPPKLPLAPAENIPMPCCHMFPGPMPGHHAAHMSEQLFQSLNRLLHVSQQCVGITSYWLRPSKSLLSRRANNLRLAGAKHAGCVF